MTWTDRLSPVGRGPLVSTVPDAAPDRDELRAVLGRFATGITVLTAGGPAPCGMTANSFASVSLDPALVLVCVLRTAAIHAAILAQEAFAVSVLSAGQGPVAKHFADRRRPRGAREFEPVDAVPGRCTGAPILPDSLAWLECALAAVYDGGDHSIFLGAVLETGRGAPGDPLVYFAGGFRRLDPDGG